MTRGVDKESVDKAMHDRVVREVAEQRFAIEDWEVRTNLGAAGPAVPDIVAIHSNSVVAVGEVETSQTICEERVAHWQEFASSCVRFYLYIPEGTEEETARLISKHNVTCAGLRRYSRNGKLDIKRVLAKSVRCRDDDHPWWVTIGSADSC